MRQNMEEMKQPKVRLLKVLLTFCLSAAIIMGTMPCEPFVMEVKADDQPAEKTITGLGVGEITHPMPTSDSSVSWNGDYVYFGKYNGNAMKYRALSILDSNTDGNNYLLLDCDNVLTNDKFDGDSNIWAGNVGDSFIESDIHKWLVGDQFYNKAGVFSTVEKNAIIGDNTNYEGHWKVGNYPDETYRENNLTAEDPVFLLDARSVINSNLGYLSNTAASASRIKKDLNGDPAKWWLRSKSTEMKDGKPCVFSVETDGSLSKNSVSDNSVGVSPALTVNLARVLYSSKVESNETESVYKLTLLESSALGSPVCMPCTRDGNKVTISYSVSYGQNCTPTQLSVVVTKNYKWDSNSGWIKKSEDAELLQYAKLDTGDSFNAVGTGTFTLDDEKITGEWGKDYNVYILAEKVNGEDETDYASEPVEIQQLEVSVLKNEYTYDGDEHGLVLSAINADYIEKERLYGETPDSCSLNSLGITNVSESPKRIYYIVNVKNRLSAKGYATVTIKKAPLNVRASDRSIPYGSPLPEDFELDCIGLAYNDDSSVLKGTEKLKFECDYVQGKDAGSYPVRIKGELTADNYNVNLADGVLEVVRATHPDVNVSGNAAYGTEGILELKDRIEAGGTLGSVSVSADDYRILDGAPSADGTRLRFKFKNDPENVGKKAKVTVSVNGAKNYLDYTINTELEVISCDHSNKKLVEGTTIPGTCTQEGYEGDYRCPDCGAVIRGKNTPIDPENHDFAAVEVVKPATIITKGETKYRCSRCHTEKIVADIPCVEEGEEKDYDDLRKDVEGLSGNDAPKIEEKKDENGNTIEETVTIGGEEISKTVTDPESGKETIVSKVWIAGLEKTYTYTGSAIKPAVRVYDGTRKLIEKTDYTLSYKNNKEVGTNAEIIVKFKGSYASSESTTAGFEIVKARLGKDIVACDTGTTDEKKVSKAVPALTWAETGKSVNSKFFEFDYSDVVNGESVVTITPKSNYSGTYDGTATAKVKILTNNNLQISKAKIVFNPKSYAYTGKEIVPSYKVTIGTNTLVKDTDFVETIINGVNPGTATVLIEAKPGNSKGYVGNKTATFKITGTRAINGNEEITFEVSNPVPFAKGGAKAAVVVRDRGTVLKEGVDYTLSYSKNKAVTTGETAEVKIKGKGSYKGTETKKFAVTKQNLSKLEGNVIIADQFVKKDKLKKPSITITDLDGKKLSAAKDYGYTVDETYKEDPDNTDESGTVKVTISAKESGAYEGTVTASFRYRKPEANIGKAKIANKIADQTYTGYAVKLSNDDLKDVLQIGSTTLEPGKDFIIDKGSYQNNNKKGTAKVTVIGTGDIAGRKTITFKILVRPVHQ